MSAEPEQQIDQSIFTAERIKRLAKAVGIIDCYGHFRQGQDGFEALLELKRFVDEATKQLSPYGFCPHCAGKAVSRERRPDGNDTCVNGHVYPSRAAR